jgi:hypothetical protein
VLYVHHWMDATSDKGGGAPDARASKGKGTVAAGDKTNKKLTKSSRAHDLHKMGTSATVNKLLFCLLSFAACLIVWWLCACYTTCTTYIKLLCFLCYLR